MGNTEKEFSMPQEITVCHDENRIYGMRLTLKMHRFKYRDQEEIALELEQTEMLERIDSIIQAAQPREMSMIGSAASRCETANIFAEG